jgi:hypothetical protein
MLPWQWLEVRKSQGDRDKEFLTPPFPTTLAKKPRNIKVQFTIWLKE